MIVPSSRWSDASKNLAGSASFEVIDLMYVVSKLRHNTTTVSNVDGTQAVYSMDFEDFATAFLQTLFI